MPPPGQNAGDKPISVPPSFLYLLIAALLGGAGTSGGFRLLSPDPYAECRSELIQIRTDVNVLSDKVKDIYTIVDKAHPRTGMSGEREP